VCCNISFTDLAFDLLVSRFHEAIEEDPSSCLLKYAPIPDKGKLKNFVLWLYERSTGLLGENLVETTMMNRWDIFKKVFERETLRPMPKDLSSEIREYIRQLTSASTEMRLEREKPIITYIDVLLLIEFLWHQDEYEYYHPRQRAQIIFFIHLDSITGARPGTVIESSAYIGSNDCLKYKVGAIVLVYCKRPG
jgi:hypothetical protein